MPKVFIAVPCLDMVAADFAFSLAGVLNRRVYDPKLRKEWDVAMACQKGSLVMDARNALAKKALDINATHLFFWDSDIILPPDALDRLISHHKDIVGATYPKRYPPHELLGEVVEATAVGGASLLPMLTLPFGCILIRTSVLHSMPFPYFKYLTTEDYSMGEDVYFCNVARKLGHTIWCDTKLTSQVGHVGQQILRSQA